MTATDLQAYVGASTSDISYVTDCFDEATALVIQFVGKSYVPKSIVDRAVLEVGSELYHRRSAPNGIAQFGALDGAPIRVARDPMVGAYPLLQRYMTVGIA
jgi:predicted Zn-dependent peptidase